MTATGERGAAAGEQGKSRFHGFQLDFYYIAHFVAWQMWQTITDVCKLRFS